MTALIRLPQALDRFIRLPDKDGALRYITLEDTVLLFINKLFPAIKSRDRARSASSATAISKSRKKPKIWCASSKAR